MATTSNREPTPTRSVSEADQKNASRPHIGFIFRAATAALVLLGAGGSLLSVPAPAQTSATQKTKTKAPANAGAKAAAKWERAVLDSERDYLAPLDGPEAKIAVGTTVNLLLDTGKRFDNVEVTELLLGKGNDTVRSISVRNPEKKTKQKFQINAVSQIQVGERLFDVLVDNEGVADWVGAAVVPTCLETERRQRTALAEMQKTGSMGGNFFAENTRLDRWQHGTASHLTSFLLSVDATRYRALITGIKEGFGWEESLKLAYGWSSAELVRRYGASIGIANLQP